jgi:hypothetical protein
MTNEFSGYVVRRYCCMAALERENHKNNYALHIPPCFATISRYSLRSCFKIPQLARIGVINRFKMLIVNCAFEPIYALSRTHLRGFKTASKPENPSAMGITG